MIFVWKPGVGPSSLVTVCPINQRRKLVPEPWTWQIEVNNTTVELLAQTNPLERTQRLNLGPRRYRLISGCLVMESAGDTQTVLLRSDGTAVAFGYNDDGQCNIPLLDEGISYTQVSVRFKHTVLLRSDGTAVACGYNDYGQCNIPRLDEGISYTDVSAGRLQCFSEVMALLWLVETITMDNVTFLR